MAIVKQCDRCGKIYNHYPMTDSPRIYNAFKLVRKNSLSTVELNCSTSVDLCGECMYDLRNFMSMKGGSGIKYD